MQKKELNRAGRVNLIWIYPARSNVFVIRHFHNARHAAGTQRFFYFWVLCRLNSDPV